MRVALRSNHYECSSDDVPGASADVVGIGGGPTLGRAGFSIAARGLANEALHQNCRLLMGGRRGGSLFDELGCFPGMRHVGHMAGIHFDRLGIGPLRHHALLVRVDRPV